MKQVFRLSTHDSSPGGGRRSFAARGRGAAKHAGRENETNPLTDGQKTQILIKLYRVIVRLAGRSDVTLNLQNFFFLLFHQILDFRDIGVGEFLHVCLRFFPFIV